MNNKLKKRTVRFLLVAFFTLAFCVYSFSCVWYNGSGGGYEGAPENGGSSAGTIENYVIKGAGYYLESYSSILLYLNKIELADLDGIDYAELKSIVKNALDNMVNTQTAYSDMIKLAEVTPYNQEVIARLQAFNYDAFAAAKNVNPAILDEVKNYLQKGDITGSYKHMAAHLDSMVQALQAIDEKISANTLPCLELSWKLNQEAAFCLLSGQTVAEIFSGI